MNTVTECHTSQMIDSNPMLLEVMEKNSDGYFILSDAHTILYANAMAQVLLVKSFEQLKHEKLPFSFSVKENIEISFQNAANQQRLLDVWAIETQWQQKTFFIVRIRELSERDIPSSRLNDWDGPFKQLAENIKEVFWLTSTDYSKVLYVSPAYEEIWGRSRSYLYDNPSVWMEAILPEDHEKVFDGLSKNINEKKNLNVEYRIVRPNGDIRHIRDRAFPICNEVGEVESIAGIAEDITAQREAENLLEQHKLQLAKSARLTTAGELVSSISHELHQPLSAATQYLGGCLLLIKKNHSLNEISDGLVKVMERIEHAGNIVHGLKNFIRKGQQKKAINRSIHAIIENVLALVNTKLVVTNVKVELCLHQQETVLLIDTVQIEQVLLNLIQNAIEAMESSNRKRILILETTQKDGLFKINVEDTGVGISQDNIKQLFKSFFTTKENGMGVGLSISHSIIEAHGGRLSVDSECGRGTQFSIQLPIHNEGPFDD